MVFMDAVLGSGSCAVIDEGFMSVFMLVSPVLRKYILNYGPYQYYHVLIAWVFDMNKVRWYGTV